MVPKYFPIFQNSDLISHQCVTKKRHYVDRKLRDEKVASHFGNVMIVIAIINNGPCLVLQILYVF